MNEPAHRKAFLVVSSGHVASRIRDLVSEAHDFEADIDHVEDLDDALEAISQSTFDVILLTIGGHASRGLQTLSIIHGREPSLPVVVLSDADDRDLGINALNLGARGHLLRGELNGASLLRAIRYALERQRSHRDVPSYSLSPEGSRDESTQELPRSRPLDASPILARDGLVFGDVYRAEKVLGLGGMGVVYFGIDTSLDREVAIKVLYVESMGESIDEIRFTREARTLATIEHPGIVPVYAYGKEGQYNYFVMQYIRGISLEAMLADEVTRLEDILPQLEQVFDSLDYLHARGVIHRDLKPSNIIFTEENRAVLVDFGVAKEVGRSRITHTSVLIGTPTYMSPEQAVTPHSVGPASDQYSFGVLIYEILCGRTPFIARSPVAVLYRLISEEPAPIRSHNPDVSKTLESVVMRAISKKPDHRFPSCRHFYEALAQAVRTSSAPRRGAERAQTIGLEGSSVPGDDHGNEARAGIRSAEISSSDMASHDVEANRGAPEPGLDIEEYAASQWLDDMVARAHRADAASRLRRFERSLNQIGEESLGAIASAIEDLLEEPTAREKLVKGVRALAFDEIEAETFALKALLSRVLTPALTTGGALPPPHLFEAYAWISTPSHLMTWQELLTDPEPQRRILGYWALPFVHQTLHREQKIKESFKVVQMLYWGANDPDEQVAVTALRGLARVGISEVAEPLVQCFRVATTETVRLEALEALLELATLDVAAIEPVREDLVAEREAVLSDEDALELKIKLELLLQRFQ